MNRTLAYAFALALLLVLLIPPHSGRASPGNLRVSFINVGQGDSTLLHDDSNFDILIDGGQPSAGSIVVNYLRQQHINDIDVMVSTHTDSDHVGGLINVLQMTDVPVLSVFYNGYPGSTITWNDFVTAVSQEGLTLTPLQYPGTSVWGSVIATTLNPDAGLTSPEQNDASVVLRIEHGSLQYLLTGDISSAVEPTVANRGTSLSSQILKVAHHGRAYSSSASFLSAVQPAEAIISVGTNSYGLPAPETLTRLQAVGARVWRTDQSGTITVTDDGTTYSMSAPQSGYSLFLPLISRYVTPTPTGMPGYNISCIPYGVALVCASVSDPTPPQNSTVTVYGQLRIKGVGLSGLTMSTTWHYKTTTSSCSGTTGADGIAQCSRDISSATVGYQVNVDVAIGGYSTTTWFTPN